MCFSATASFAASAVLIPIGIYCLKKASEQQKPYWLILLLPLAFGVQQFFEGLVWLDLNQGKDPRYAALAFVFFSHLFWLFWIPLACYKVETQLFKRRLFLIFIVLGGIHGLVMFVPFIIFENWLELKQVQHSIEYTTTLVYDEFLPRIVVRIVYATIVLVPLLFCSDRYIKIFGIFIMISVVVSTIFFGYAFISVWCYFAAILSLYFVVMIFHLNKNKLEVS